MKWIIVALLLLQNAFAHDLPLWEAGAGMLNFRAPHYRGSKQHKDYYWPLPYAIIRGEKVQADNSFMRGNFYLSKKLSIDLSLNAGLNVNSKDNRIRQGMPNIDNSFEIGPMVRFFLWKSENEDNIFNLEMPLRSVFTTNFKSINHIGFFNIPYFNYISAPQPWNLFWAIEASIGPMFASKKYHNYYYKISENYALPERPFYESKSGYSGLQGSIMATKRYKNWLFFPFIRYDYLKGAAFEDSPLIETQHYRLYGFGIVYFFGHSKERQGNIYQVR
jgi:outer membrane protein